MLTHQRGIRFDKFNYLKKNQLEGPIFFLAKISFNLLFPSYINFDAAITDNDLPMKMKSFVMSAGKALRGVEL